MLRYFWPSDDEQLAGQFNASFFDEDSGYWSGVQKSGATLALAVALTLTSVSTALASSVFSQHQDDPAGSLVTQVLVQEEYWQNPTPPVNWPQPSVITADDTHNQFVEAFQEDEDRWDPQIPPTQALQYVQLPLGLSEDFPAFPATIQLLSDGDIWTPQTPPADLNWTLLFFLDDGSWVPAMQPDEDFWGPQIAPANWPQPLNLSAIAGGDDLFPQPTQLDELYWQNRVAPLGLEFRTLQQWPFEQNENAGGLVVTFLDEIYWQNSVPALPASLLWPQPFLFEQNEAIGHVTDEDFWWPQIPPVNWPQPSVITDNDTPPFVPNTGEDEDYWNYFLAPNVPPVPASLFIRLPYQPDPEEIPAGSLFPTPPPVPCFMPLPPCGPDADTCISTFSNFKGGPVLALFCRICNSGLPLVVRGDYAIWCQDCCSFVSKQDTYMGTTRAPGQFKNRF